MCYYAVIIMAVLKKTESRKDGEGKKSMRMRWGLCSVCCLLWVSYAAEMEDESSKKKRLIYFADHLHAGVQ
jgi:hypothetical protein